jgi:hypothetical protein
VRGIVTLIQVTAITERWGATHYGRLNGLMSAPGVIVMALALWAGTALARVQRVDRVPLPTQRHRGIRGDPAGFLGVVADGVHIWRGAEMGGAPGVEGYSFRFGRCHGFRDMDARPDSNRGRTATLTMGIAA